MKGARGVLINITGGNDITLYEVDEAANQIREQVDPEANIIFGSTFDPNMDGNLRVSVVATGIDAEVREAGRPLVTSLSAVNEKRRAMMDLAPSSEPANAQVVAEAVQEVAAEIGAGESGSEDRPAAAFGSGSPAADLRHDEGTGMFEADYENAFEEAPPLKVAVGDGSPPPRAADNLWRRPQAQPAAGQTGRASGSPGPRPGFAGPKGLVPPMERPQGTGEPAPRPDESAQTRRHVGLFRRMTRLLGDDNGDTGSDRRRQAQAAHNAQGHNAAAHNPPAQQASAPHAASPQGGASAGRSQGARLSAVEGANRSALPKHEDDALDIPAFLRRQAN